MIPLRIVFLVTISLTLNVTFHSLVVLFNMPQQQSDLFVVFAKATITGIVKANAVTFENMHGLLQLAINPSDV